MVANHDYVTICGWVVVCLQMSFQATGKGSANSSCQWCFLQHWIVFKMLSQHI